MLLNRNWFSLCKRRESQATREFATVLRDTWRLYFLQMRRNGLNYVLNCQNHACFSRIYLSILHKLYRLQTASTDRISWAKVLKVINLTEYFNISCRGAIDKAWTVHVRGPGFDFFLVLFVRVWILWFMVRFLICSKKRKIRFWIGKSGFGFSPKKRTHSFYCWGLPTLQLTFSEWAQVQFPHCNIIILFQF